MKNKVFLVGVLLYLVLSGCKEKKDSFDFPYESNINLTKLDFPDIIGIGMQIIKIDSLLLVNDFYGDSLLRLYDIRKNELVRDLIGKGDGPEEMISPLDVQLYNNELYVLSRPLFSLSKINLSDLSSLHKVFQLPPKSDRFLPLSSSQFIFSGMWDKRFAQLIIKNNESEIKEFGDFPDFLEKEKDIPNESKFMFHQVRFHRHPEKSFFITSSGYGLEKYSFDPTGEELPKLQKRIQLGRYDYNFTHGERITATLKDNSDPGIRESACTKDFIYLVREKKNVPNETEILVFDWDFNPIRLLHCDKKITCLYVDESEQIAYCFGEDPNDMLFSFELRFG
ncbi:MAG: TolB-like 6-bladed beta-propeller domain-containing protein [Tannerellaceae bacterium]|nr:TolB-like 6-bladed beta-propeller domain-containing protein [Tannerellaceae bacterium]